MTQLSADSKAKVTFEQTPNPATLKFNYSIKYSHSPVECLNVEDAAASPIASKIFGFPWTSSVYVGTEFLTVTKQDWVEWAYLAEPLSALIQDHLNSGELLVIDLSKSSQDAHATDSPEIKLIKKTLNDEIRPVVALDGGDIVFVNYENNRVYVHMKGACAGCPSSTATLKDGVEVRLKEVLPEILEVIAI